MSAGRSVLNHETHDYPRGVVDGKIPAGRLIKLACERHLTDLASAKARGLWFDAKEATKALSFFRMLRFTKARWAGKVFQPEPWQRFFIGATYGWKRENGSRRYREAHLEVARKNGKALDVDTPIPTPLGWCRMGNLEVGDVVFAADGSQARVIGTSDVMLGHDCYRVEFSDGTSFIADAEHLWETDAKSDRHTLPRGVPRPSVRTTREIRDTLNVNRRDGIDEWNHRIALAGPLSLPDANLPVEPYTLGVWLGDGRTNDAELTCSVLDGELIDHLESVGCKTTGRTQDKRSNARAYRMGPAPAGRPRSESLRARLRAMGLLGNKHIPAAYLRSSALQRMALLQGLMDKDGTASKAGQCEFTTTRQSLSDGFLELARSLGFKPTLKIARAMLNGRDCGAKYRIQFWAFADRPCFRLSRKAGRLKSLPVRPTRAAYRQIIAVEPVESRPVKCIAIDHPTRLYLAGPGMVPTHNTETAAGHALKLVLADKEEGADVFCVATKRDQAKLTFDVASRMVAKSPDLSKHLRRLKFSVHHLKSNSKLEPLGADANSLDGLNVHGAIKDELHAWKTRELWDVLETAVGSRAQPLGITTTTAGVSRQSIWWEQRESGVKLLEGVEGFDNDEFFPLIFTLDDEDEWTDESCWIKGNPNLGVTIAIEEMRSKCKGAVREPGKTNAFRRLRLNQPTESTTKWLPVGLLKLAWDDYPEEYLEGRPCYGGIDLSQSIDLTAWALVFPPSADDPNWRLIIRHYMPGHEIEEKERRDGFNYRKCADGSRLTLTDGDVVDYELFKARIIRDADRFRLMSLAYDRRFAPMFIQYLVAEGIECHPWSQTFGGLNTGTKEFKTQLHKKTFKMPKCDLTEWECENVAIEMDAAGNERPHKGKSSGRIDGIVAAINALSLANHKYDEPVDAGVAEVDYSEIMRGFR